MSHGGARVLLLAGLFALFLPLAGRAGEKGISASCRVPDIFLTFDGELTRTERLVDRSQPVRILFFGQGAQRWAPGGKTRSRLEMELNQRLPDIRFTLENRSSALGLAEDDFERLRTAVDEVKPDLIVWQVGTGDALAVSDTEAFGRTLADAAHWLEGRGIDLVLIDPPFVGDTPHENLYRRIVQKIDALSDQEHMNVVQQYGAMRYLRGSPVQPGPDGRLCMPELVAEAIVRAVTR